MGGGTVNALSSALEAAGWRTFHVDGKKVKDKASFLSACAKAMEFPDYFGGNWDAFEECINELSWAEAKGYLVVLENMGKFVEAAPSDWKTACEIFTSAAANWKKQKTPFCVMNAVAGC